MKISTLFFATFLIFSFTVYGKEVNHIEISSAIPLPILVTKENNLYQPLEVQTRLSGAPATATLQIENEKPVTIHQSEEIQTWRLDVPAVTRPQTLRISLKQPDGLVSVRETVIHPVRKWEVYLLPHSHVDIGYTQLQNVVESLHWNYFEQAIKWARETQDYPDGSRFKWNVEVLWAVDSYLQRSSDEKREEFIDAVKNGWIGLDALYGNELTGLCRPEELVRLTDLACRLSKKYGLKIDSAMISDVPGYSWSIVPILAQSGVRYFSIGPNHSARLGFTLSDWGDRPFYWVSQSRREKVLAWVAGKGYAWFHRGRIEDDDRIVRRLMELEEQGYPYEILQARYSIGGDNGPPDVALSKYVRDWNQTHLYPRLRIATTRELFEAFEKRYAESIPSVEGDFTPYWEDGAASSARETALNRDSAERLVQADSLWSMLAPENYPTEKFRKAWTNIVLYDEHTWGAHNSVSDPDSDFAKGQWAVKQAFALDADTQSKDLLAGSTEKLREDSGKSSEVLVLNTCSWPRTDLVVLPQDSFVSAKGVFDSEGRSVPSQILSNGELAFLAEQVPPFGGKRYSLTNDGADVSFDPVRVEGTELTHPTLDVRIDPQTGTITDFRSTFAPVNLVQIKDSFGLNSYFYVPGKDPEDAVSNGPVTVHVKENGPLVASLLVSSTAPGCYHLDREIRIIAGLNRVDIHNLVDKRKIRNKEGVHFGFPFNIPQGQIRMDIGWGIIRPDADQLPGACKNWFTVQRWVDVSNQDYGVTWTTRDAPLVEVGSITAETPWIRFLGPTQTFYSYVMNNYWFTNYKADQEGPTTFRYSIQPHGRFDSTRAIRFGTERSQPLLAVPVRKDTRSIPSLLTVRPSGVIITDLKPCEEGNGYMVRLYGASARPEKAQIDVAGNEEWTIRMSNFSEMRGEEIRDKIEVPPYGIVTLRIEPVGS